MSADPHEDILSTSAAGPAAARGGALRVGGYLLATAVSALSAALLFRHLKVISTGSYAAAVTLVAIVGALSDLGLTAIGVREMSQQQPSERWRLARDLLGLRIVLTAAGGLIVTVIAWWAYSPTLAAGVALACLGLLLQAAQDNFTLPLTLGLRLGWMAALDLSRQMLTTTCTIALVLLGATLVPFLAISVPVGVVMLSVSGWLVRGTRTLTPTFSISRWRALISKTVVYSIAVAASALYFRIATLLVSALSSSKQLGYFGASFRIIEVLTLVPALLVGAAFPIFARAARDDHERLGYALGRVFEVSVIVGAWVAVSIAVAAPLAIAVIGGAEFAPAASVLAVQGVGLGAMFVSLVWANALLSLGVFRQILLLNTLTLVVVAVLVAILASIDGARGAAIGTSIAEIVAIVVQALAVVHRRPHLRPSLRVLPPTALAGAIALAPLLIPGMPTIVRLVLSTALFVAVALLAKAAPQEALEVVPWQPLRARLLSLNRATGRSGTR